jgi:hypothetical protein
MSRIQSEEDIVYSSKRFTWNNTYFDHHNFSPLIMLEQSIVKEIKADKGVSYKVFDVLTLTDKSFKLEDKVYMIIDNNVYKMKLNEKEYQNEKNITEDQEDILASDSTKVSVVTGYSENNRKITRFNYKLNNDIVSKLRNAKQVLFRYYSGPSMITVELYEYNLDNLKKFIDMQ